MPNLLKARGLITYKNEINVPDGAMDVADDIVIDEDDVIEIRRGQADFGTSLPSESDRVKQILEYKDIILRHYDSKLQFDDGLGNFTDFNGSYQELEDGLRIKYLEANGNFYFTDVTGIKKISSKSSSQINQNSIQDSGIPRALSLQGSLAYSQGGILPPQSKVAYRVLWGRKDNNNNLLLGYPSERFVITNTSKSVEVPESFNIKVLSIPTSDDIITIDTLENKYFLWFDTTGTVDTAPIFKPTLGRTGIEVDISGAATVDKVAVLIANAISSVAEFNIEFLSEDEVKFTSINGGNINDPLAYLEDNQNSSTFQITTLQQGSITEGTPANVAISFSVPTDIDSSYFYQVYRTSTVSVFEGASLSDIDPGDEMNLVDEGSVLDENGQVRTEISVEDLVPEDFRSQAGFLYTNAISGESILQANSQPPVAKDIALFNGSVFYANTKNKHRIQTSIVAVDPSRWVSGVSDFIIGNKDITLKYTGAGQTQVQDVEINTSSLNNKAWFVDSARGERSYFVWYDENGTGVVPSSTEDEVQAEEFSNKLALRVRYNSNTVVTPSVDFANDTITIPSHGLINGQELEFISGDVPGGGLPAGVVEGTIYLAQVEDSDTIKIIDKSIPSLNQVVDITSTGSDFKVKTYPTVFEMIDLTSEALNSTEDFFSSIKIITGLDSTNNVDEATDSINIPAHGLEDGDLIEFVIEEEGTELPVGLSESTIYEVIESDQDNIKISPVRGFLTGVTPLSLGEAQGTFSIKTNSMVTIHWKNGVTPEAVGSSLITNDEVTFKTPSIVGQGEDTLNKQFLISSQVSVSASIDETARSLVKVINADPDSPVSAFYISGSSDVPGKILLEARNPEDNPFYIGTSDSSIKEDFDPSLNVQINILSTTPNGNTTDVQLDTLVEIGQELFFYDLEYIDNNLNSKLPFQNGKYVVNSVDPLTLVVNIDAVSTVSSTSNKGAAFIANNESDNEEALNRIFFSKIFQPEAVPTTNFIDIGPKDKAINRILPLRDNLFALKEDGVYIISGSSAPNFTVRLLDSSTIVIAPDTAVVLNNAIYALSDDGVVQITDTGIQVISRNIEDLIKQVVNSRFDIKKTSFGVGYTSDRSYLLWVPSTSSDTVSRQCYRYNTFTRTWTKFNIPATCGVVASRDDKMYLGSGDRNFLTQERKNNDRTDHADRDFDLNILPESVQGTTLTLNNASDITEGDVIYQEQYVTISILRRLLLKLDAEQGLDGYFDTIELTPGIKVSNVVDTIVAKLIEDGINVSIGPTSDDIEEQRNQYNDLIDQLNDTGSGTFFKNYKKAESLVPYEMVVLSVNIRNNTVELYQETPFVENTVTVFKSISAKWQYAPIHFGDPSSLKQVRQGTVIFDQNNFYGGTLAFATDLSADFIDVPFRGYGPGNWGEDWGNGTWGGSGNDIPHRTLLPLEKQRCRYLTVQVRYDIARDIVRVNGISLMVRVVSNRAYR